MRREWRSRTGDLVLCPVRIWISPAAGPRADHGRVQRLVEVPLRHRDEVLEASGSGFQIEWMTADRPVAVLDQPTTTPHRGEVEDLVELPALRVILV